MSALRPRRERSAGADDKSLLLDDHDRLTELVGPLDAFLDQLRQQGSHSLAIRPPPTLAWGRLWGRAVQLGIRTTTSSAKC